jgi:hypothetical protein
MKYILLILITCSSLILAAEKPKFKTLTTTKGKTYEDVTVMKVKTASIFVMHKTGGANIKVEDLTPETQKALGIDMGKVSDIKLKQSTDALLKVARIGMMGTVLQVLEDGVLVNGAYERKQTRRKIKYKESYQVKVGGPTGLHPNSRAKTITRYRDKWKWVTNNKTINYGLIYVQCDTSRFVDGSDFNFYVYSYGKHSYSSVGGSVKTVEKYTSSSEKYLKSVGVE